MANDESMSRLFAGSAGERSAAPGEPAPSRPASLAELVARLSDQHAVAGIVLGGSHAVGRETPWSDLDLLLVFAGPDLPFTLVTTTLGETLTEIVCCAVDDLRAVERGGTPAHWDAGAFIRFLGGRILFDREGSLGRAARWAAAQPAPGPDVDPYSRWRHAQYNLRQTRRFLATGDEAARAAVVARMLYSLHDILRDYFIMRGMAWPGDKVALKYWASARAGAPCGVAGGGRRVRNRAEGRGLRGHVFACLCAVRWARRA